MNNLLSNIGHIVMSALIIIAVTVLAWHGTISGSDALVIIAALGGVSVGGSVASSSAGAPALGSVAASASTGASTSALISPATTPPSVTTTTTTQNPGSVL